MEPAESPPVSLWSQLTDDPNWWIHAFAPSYVKKADNGFVVHVYMWVNISGMYMRLKLDTTPPFTTLAAAQRHVEELHPEDCEDDSD